MNKLYYGDTLQVLRDYVVDASVDLIYLDPPFTCRQDYNVLFAEKDGSRSTSQITAFNDSWEWNLDAEREQHSESSQLLGSFLALGVSFWERLPCFPQ